VGRAPALGFLKTQLATQESEDIHPPLVCNSCYLTMRQLHIAKETGRYRETGLVPRVWEPHLDNNCHLCEAPSATPRGQPKKRRLRADPPLAISTIGSTRSHTTSHTQKNSDSPLEVSYFLPSPYIEHLSCKICNSIPSEPIQILGCQHLLRKGCIYKVCEGEGQALTCHCNNTPLEAESLCLPSELVCKCLDSLPPPPPPDQPAHQNDWRCCYAMTNDK
jgi:hypothetical protein